MRRFLTASLMLIALAGYGQTRPGGKYTPYWTRTDSAFARYAYFDSTGAPSAHATRTVMYQGPGDSMYYRMPNGSIVLVGGGGTGSGDIEGVTAGWGIIGGGTSGTVPIAADSGLLASNYDLSFYTTTSALNALLAAKSDTSHTHPAWYVTGLQDSLNARARAVHAHLIAELTGMTDSLGARMRTIRYDSDADDSVDRAQTAAWAAFSGSADTLTGDVNLMKVNDSLDVGGGDFTIRADGTAGKVAGIVTGIGGMGLPAIIGVISHGDPVTPDYTADIDAETDGGGLTIWWLYVKSMTGSYDLTHSIKGTLVTATGDAMYSGMYYAGEGGTFSFYFSGDGSIAFRAFSLQFTTTQ